MQCRKFTLFLYILLQRLFNGQGVLGIDFVLYLWALTLCSSQNRAPGLPMLGDCQLPPSAQIHSDHSDVNGHRREDKTATLSSRNELKS